MQDLQVLAFGYFIIENGRDDCVVFRDFCLQIFLVLPDDVAD